MDSLQENIRQQSRARSGALEEALGVAEKFSHDWQDAVQALRDIQDNLMSQDSPGVDPQTIQEQQRELEVEIQPLYIQSCVHICNPDLFKRSGKRYKGS